jgi:hypothetical protein
MDLLRGVIRHNLRGMERPGDRRDRLVLIMGDIKQGDIRLDENLNICEVHCIWDGLFMEVFGVSTWVYINIFKGLIA